MEIKSRMTSAIQPKVTSENVENKNPAVQSGIGNVKDGFESAGINAARSESKSQLSFVKQQMGNFMVSNSAVNSNDSIFSVMMEYQKTMNKEAREDHKLARASESIKLSVKQSKLLSNDDEIKSAKGSQDMYQVVDQDAAMEFYIGQAGRLMKGDNKKDIESMKSALDELKKSADEIKQEILQKNPDKDHVNKRYDMLISWISSRKDDD